MQSGSKCRLRKRAVHFSQAGLPVLAGYLLKARPAQRFAQLAYVDIRLAVAFTLKGQHGIGPGLHSPFHHSGEVDTQKRKVGVRYRINQVVDQVLFVRLEFVVLAPERNNFDVNGGGLGHLSNFIRVQPRTVDYHPCGIATARGNHRTLTVMHPNISDLLSQLDFCLLLPQQICIAQRDLSIVNNAGLGYPNSL